MTEVLPFLSHLGGLHELALFALPALAAIFALRWAEKRAASRSESTESDNESEIGGEDGQR